MPTPLDPSPAPEPAEVNEAAPNQPIRTPVRSVYLKVLAAVVAMTILGSPTLIRLAEMIDLGSMRGMHAASALTAMALALVMLILAPIALIRLRLEGREIIRSYGVSALLASTLGVGFTAPSVALSMLLTMKHMVGVSWSQWPQYFLLNVARSAVESSALAITVAWLVLALTGVGRRPSGGFEWLGLGLGLLWMLMYLGRFALELVPFLL